MPTMSVTLLYGLSRLIVSFTALGLLAGLLAIYLHTFRPHFGNFFTLFGAAGMLLLGRLIIFALLCRSNFPAPWSLRVLHILLLTLSCGCGWLYFGEYLTRPWHDAMDWRNLVFIQDSWSAPHQAWFPGFHGPLRTINISGSDGDALPAKPVARNPDPHFRFAHAPVDLLRIRLWQSFGITLDREGLSAGLAVLLALSLELGTLVVLRHGLSGWIERLQDEQNYRRLVDWKRLETALPLQYAQLDTAALQDHIRNERARLERQIRRAANLDD